MPGSGKVISNSVKILRGVSRSIPQKEPFIIVLFKIIFINLKSDAALKRFQILLKEKPQSIGLRIGVNRKGCSGYAYDLKYCDKENITDLKVIKNNVTLFVDNKAQLTLIGSEIDFIEDELGSEFVFLNPHIKNLCGCGESFNF